MTVSQDRTKTKAQSPTSDTFFSEFTLSCDLLAALVGVGGWEWSMNSGKRPFVLKEGHTSSVRYSQTQINVSGAHTHVNMQALTEND